MKFGWLIKGLIGILLLAGAFSTGYMARDMLNTKSVDEQEQFNQHPVYFPDELSETVKIQGQGGATCTTGNEFTIIITGAKEVFDNPVYRVTCGSFDSQWVTEDTVTITGLKNPGPYTANVRISDNPEDPDNGNIEEAIFTFFKLRS